MKNIDNKKKVLLLLLAIGMIISITTFSYAWFVAQVNGNPTNNNVVTSGKMEITYTDGQVVGTTSNMLPGQSITKTFTVRNTGNVATSYDIYLNDVVNTFADKNDLVYSLTSTGGGTTINQSIAPSSNTKIASNVSLAVNATHTYTLTIRFLETNNDQSDNMGVSFSATIGLVEKEVVEELLISSNEDNFLKIGDVVKPVVLGHSNATCTSSNSSILSIDNKGYINALSAGSANITCSDNQYSKTVSMIVANNLIYRTNCDYDISSNNTNDGTYYPGDTVNLSNLKTDYFTDKNSITSPVYYELGLDSSNEVSSSNLGVNLESYGKFCYGDIYSGYLTTESIVLRFLDYINYDSSTWTSDNLESDDYFKHWLSPNNIKCEKSDNNEDLECDIGNYRIIIGGMTIRLYEMKDNKLFTYQADYPSCWSDANNSLSPLF